MTERGRASVVQTPTVFAVGPSSLSWDGTALTIALDEITMPFPSRIRGTIRVHPSALTQTAYVLNPDGAHRWWPVAPCARVQVALDQPSLRWLGDGYFDMNSGDAPLENGFSTWEWSRATLRDGAAILYEAHRRNGERLDLALRVDRAGRAETFTPPGKFALPRSGWRVARNARSEGTAMPHVVKTLEDAPFYARSLVSASLLGEPVTVMHESLSLDRFRKPLVQAMLPFRMPRAWR